MTRADLLERIAFWQVGLMDIDHLRDVAYEAMETEFDGEEFRLIAGDAKIDNDDARDLLARAFRAAGMDLPNKAEAERIVAASVARSVLAGAVEPMWGAELISGFHRNREGDGEGLPPEVWGPLEFDSCACCNGLDEMIGAEKRALRRKECREDIRRHLAEVLPRIEAWAGLPLSPAGIRPTEPGFLGWRRPSDSWRAEWRDLDRKIRWVLLRFWDPMGVADTPAAKGEYDASIPHLQRLLTTVASDADLSRELEEYLGRREEELAGEEAALRREATIRELLHLRDSW
jgi:hypothetical protein